MAKSIVAHLVEQIMQAFDEFRCCSLLTCWLMSPKIRGDEVDGGER